MGWRTVSGAIMDAVGEHLAGAIVNCYQASDYPSVGSCAPYTEGTGDGGRFAFRVFLHPGDWVRIIVFHQGHHMSSTNVAAEECTAGCPDLALTLQSVAETPEPTATFALWPKGTAEVYPRSDCVTATPVGGTPDFPRGVTVTPVLTAETPTLTPTHTPIARRVRVEHRHGVRNGQL